MNLLNMENCYVNLHQLRCDDVNVTVAVAEYEGRHCRKCLFDENSSHKRKKLRSSQSDPQPSGISSNGINVNNCFVDLHRLQNVDVDMRTFSVSQFEENSCRRCKFDENIHLKRRSLDITACSLQRSGIADEFFKFFEFSSAAYDGDLEAIKRFLSEGLLHQVPEYRGWTVIHTCVFANQAEALRAILDYNPKNRKFLANLCIWEGSSLLYLSILRDGTSIDVIRTLLESGANPNKCTNEGFSPLHLACYKKRSVEVVKLLVNHGADVNATEAKIKYTPLHFAIDVGADIDLLEYLVDICDVNVEDSVHKTPLFKACASDFMEAVKLILKKDTRSVNVSPISEFSALSSAASVGNLEMVRLLLEAGADTEFKGRAKVDQQMFQQNNFLPIHSAFSNIEVFKLLLKNTGSATIEKHDSLLYPLTFLIYTVVYGPSTEFLEALLEHEFPPELGHLKTPTVQHLISFFLATSHELPPEVLHAKFHLFFKYFLHLTPVSFVERQILSEELVDNYNILHLLTRMGLCADFGLSSRQILLRSLNLMEADSVRDSVISETISLLNQPVLSLMQLSRLKCRQHLREKVQDDWTAYKMVRDSCLPNALKQYLWFQVLD